MAEFITPTNSLAARIARRVRKQFTGTDIMLSAELGVLPDAKMSQTTAHQKDDFTPGDQNDDSIQRPWLLQNDMYRRERYRTFQEWYDRIPEMKGIVKIIVKFVFGGEPDGAADRVQSRNRLPFQIGYREGADEVRRVGESATKALNLYKTVVQMFEFGLRRGDAAAEVISSLTEVVGRRSIEVGNMDVLWDRFQRLQGYRVTPGRWSIKGDSSPTLPRNTTTLGPLQVVHFAPQQQWGDRYGQGIYHGIDAAATQFDTITDLLHTLALLQGANRRLTMMEFPKDATADSIKADINRIRFWNRDVSFFDKDGKLHKGITKFLDYTDKIFPYRKGTATPIVTHDPPPPFKDLTALARFDQGRLYLGTNVPKALAGLIDDANSRAALAEQGMHFVKILRDFQAEAASLALEFLYTSLLIAGVKFQPGDVWVKMNIVSEFNEKLMAEVEKLRAEAAKTLGETSVPMRWILTKVLRVPGDMIESMLADVAVIQAQKDSVASASSANPTDSQAEHVIRSLSEQVEQLRETLRPVVVDIGEIIESRKVP